MAALIAVWQMPGDVMPFLWALTAVVVDKVKDGTAVCPGSLLHVFGRIAFTNGDVSPTGDACFAFVQPLCAKG